jgi:phosphate transport system substrate-binding protein
MTSRQIRPEEVRSLAALGAMDSPAAEHVIALIGIAVIVNPANPVTQLSLEQIADIYLGHISNWSQVGGQDAPIHLYAHTIPSGMVDFFREVAMKGGEISSTAKFIKNSTEQSNAVAADPLAIGMVGLPYVLDSRALAISASQSEGVRYVLPNLLTVKSEIYPITARLYLYTPVHSNNPMVGEFVRYATSPEGQAVVATQKFVRYDVEKMAAGPRAVTTAANAPDAYKEMTRDADLLQIIYFNTGSRTPEPLAMTLMDTLPNKLDELHLRPSQLMLFGFTDNVGSAAFNMNLSRERVDMITHALDSRGIKVGKGLGFGGTNFLRSNRNDADRRYNRRIEIWASKAG